MKKFLSLLLSAALAALALTGCGTPQGEPSSAGETPPITGTAAHLNILLPYAASSAVVEQHRDGFIASLRHELADRGWAVEDITLSVAPTAAASGKALDDSTADLAILPASQYFTYSDDVDLLMTATKPGVSVNSLNAADWNGSAEHPTYTDEDCPYSRTLICATNSETGRALAQSAKNGTLTWEELSAAKWMYAKASSSSDFFYPDLWLSEQFGKTLEDLPNLQAMDGYGALFSEASAEEADVIVIPADLRIDYAEAWQLAADDIDSTGKMGFGHEDSIFNEIQVLGVTAPIWGDVMVLRAGEEPFGDTDFQSALLGAMDALEKDSDARAIWESCGYTGFTASGGSHYDNIRDRTVFGTGD
ncbi:PhnD/SsuA/transferrin family substrate-binding protein [bacterium 210917-DFI.7.65]|nr:PhnD/SsuA/transferrin family substrate-binding protein [Clostridiales bacterium]MCB6899609.1 PhnD/SsuA/transferrin family substrate-binding protein [bacterium 210917-DFI.7.65]